MSSDSEAYEKPKYILSTSNEKVNKTYLNETEFNDNHLKKLNNNNNNSILVIDGINVSSSSSSSTNKLIKNKNNIDSDDDENIIYGISSSYKYNRNRHRNSIGTFLSVPQLLQDDLRHDTISNNSINTTNQNIQKLQQRKISSSPINISSSTSIYCINNNNNNNNVIKDDGLKSSSHHIRRLSQDSGIVTGKISGHFNFDTPTTDSGTSQFRNSTDNIQIYQNIKNQNFGLSTSFEEDNSIDSIMENESETDKWLVTSTMAAALLPIPKNENDSLKSSPHISRAFGPKIGCENIPGTPMIGIELIHSEKAVLNQKLPPSSDHYYDINQSNIIQDNFNKYSSRKNSDKSNSQSQLEESTSTNDSVSSKMSKRSSQDLRRVSKQDKEGLDPESLLFRDGRRRIDMVLAWEEENEGVMTEIEARRRDYRRNFQENMIKEGLELELEDKSQSFDEKTYFLKIHLPWRLETRYAEVMNLKLPIKRFITISVKAWDEENIVVKKLQVWTNFIAKFRKMIQLDGVISEEEPTFKKATAGGNPEEQFIVKDRATNYTCAQRSLMVFQILLRTKFEDSERLGIRRLLNDRTYLACFPLHEGRYDQNISNGVQLDRRKLYLTWARPSQWYKKQPLCLIRKYFGDKIALYFCWLGFYTQMLIYPSIVGTLCFLYGLASLNSEDNTPSKEICDKNGVGNTTLCPLCDKACSYQSLSDSCLFARITYLFDNPSTVFFAIFMSFWATTFLELWKRKQSVIVWEWDLHNIESDEENRPEFETNATEFRINPVTREKEPYMSTYSKAIRFAATSAAVLFMMSIVLAAVLGTIIYRISLVSVIYGGGGFFVKNHAKLFTSVTAALINLVVIMILTKIYHRLAIHLTNMENPRTHTEYEDSYTFKIFFFEFMNFYSSLIYIAFFKGRFFDYPGDKSARRNEFFRLKNDICDPAGCLSELCIQLAIIMVGKQCWNNFMEYLFPKFYNWWRQRKHKAATIDETHLHMSWEQDYHMQDPGRLALFDEYLEMILQYGFVTLFVAAFPLAPLFALLNNIAEIRLDAFKMVTQARRPLAERVEDIGAWYGILRIITYAAVVSNAFVIAYTSDFIPRMVYKLIYSNDNTLQGYLDHSLSIFNTSDYKEEWGVSNEKDPDTCKYRGYRNDPTDSDPYNLSPHYWHVFAARLAFVVVFEHVVFVITGIMQFVIPDIPAEVRTQIQREQLLAKEAKLQHGLKKAQQDENIDLLSILREQQGSNQAGGRNRGSWARRLSRLSDGLDAHIEVTSRPRRSIESTVWEDT